MRSDPPTLSFKPGFTREASRTPDRTPQQSPARHLRVVHAYRTYFPDPAGGVQEAIRQICLATSHHDISSSILALTPDDGLPRYEARPEGEVVRARSWIAPASCDIGLYQAFSRFARLVEQADVVHYHFPWPFGDLLHAIVRPSIPAVMTYHSDIVRQQWLGKLYAPLMRRTLASMSAIAATSPAYAQTSGLLNQPDVKKKVHVIPLGVDESTYDKSPDDSVFEQIGIDPGEPYFLFIGVLRYYKGLHHLVEAARSVKTPIVIAGSGPEGPALAQKIDRLGLTHLKLAGQVSEPQKHALLAHCRAFVMPSHLRSEAFGVSLIEAAMYGKPLVSCDIGTGTTYVNLHDETGLVVRAGQSADLAKALQTLEQDQALCTRLGQAARIRYEAHFSGPALGQAYADLYRQVSGARPT